MKVLVGIATYKRPEKLNRLLASLAKQTYTDFDVLIGFDNGDEDSVKAIHQQPNLHMGAFVSNTHSYVIGLWNEIHRRGAEKYDAHLTLVDDVVLNLDCIEKAVQLMGEDTDKVIGIFQNYPTGNKSIGFCHAGQVMIGSAFVERHKEVEYKVCCPDYIQWWQDQELLEFSQSIGKFYLSTEAQLTHFHPMYSGDTMDEAHREVRGIIVSKDRETRKQRVNRNLLWGREWGLVNK
jgi:hypothetical protein